jgi:hypothetical protein
VRCAISFKIPKAASGGVAKQATASGISTSRDQRQRAAFDVPKNAMGRRTKKKRDLT